MKIKIELTEDFKKDVKKLQKKYKNIKSDIQELITKLKENPSEGTDLGDGFYKIRTQNSDMNKGKSGGYRTITYYNDGDTVLLLIIYSKSNTSNVSKNEIKNILEKFLKSGK